MLPVAYAVVRRMAWFLLGLIVGGAVVGYTTRDAISRLQSVESQLTDVTSELKGVEGALAGIPPRLGDVRIKLQRIGKFIDPVDAATRTGDEALYIATRPGKVFRLESGKRPEEVLDLTRRVDDLGVKVGVGWEAGLLGITFSPRGDRFYVTYTATWEKAKKSVIWTLDEMKVGGDDIDPDSRRTLLAIRKKLAHHNGGVLRFGPDGYLYTSIGDAQPSGDDMKTGQNTSDLLASILRIDPRPSKGKPYTVPKDNPFVGIKGSDEIWAFGVRNPWRISFDRATGDLWVADVGADDAEEINFLPAKTGHGRGANLGWPLLEGDIEQNGGPPKGYVAPIKTYDHNREHCAIIGGFVYRGRAIPQLRGGYLHADYCGGEIRGLALVDGDVVDRPLGSMRNPSSFAEDAEGELLVLSIKGDVYRIVPA
jgi:glucose/arabinose dehydrogenase